MSPHKSLMQKWIPVSSKMITLRLGIRAKIRPAFKKVIICCKTSI